MAWIILTFFTNQSSLPCFYTECFAFLFTIEMSFVSPLLFVIIVIFATGCTSPPRTTEAQSFTIHTRETNTSSHALRQRLRQKLMSLTSRARPRHLDPARVFPALPSGFVYVTAYIGTPPLRVNLALDTLFPFTWVQTSRWTGRVWFNLSFPFTMFDPKKSTTFHLLSPNNTTLCSLPFTKAGSTCAYDAGFSEGIYGVDEFRLLSPSSTRTTHTNEIAFGCSSRTDADFDAGWNFNIIGGMIGLGRGHPSSIVTQLGSDRFSYCIRGRSDSQSGQPTLNFGSDAFIDATADNVQTTPISCGSRDFPYYNYLTMTSLTVNGDVVYIMPQSRTIAKRVLLDTGGGELESSCFITDAYFALQDGIEKYFRETYGWRKTIIVLPTSYDPCYRLRTNLSSIVFPKIAIQFLGGASIELPDVFKIFPDDHQFCSVIMEGAPNVIGVHQQMGYRFLFDLARSKLSFAPNMC